MGKKLTPYEIVDNFITKRLDHEIDKWNAGLKNSMEEWENFIEYWNLIEEVERIRKDNAELRMYNEKLLNDNSKYCYKYQKLLESILDFTKSNLELLETDGINAKSIVANNIQAFRKELGL